MTARITALTAIAGAGAALFAAALVLSPRPPEAPLPADASRDLLAEMRAAFDERQAPPLSGTWRLSLPEDHGAHPEANAETWSLVAHLRDAEGARVPLLFTLSRFGAAAEATATDTHWTPREAWLGQAAIAQGDARAEERLSRGVGAAGTDAAAGTVWLDDWVLRHPAGADAEGFRLQARVEGHPVDLTLVPVKPPVAPGEATEGPARGFALPRLEVSGRMGPDASPVTGTAWIDRLWGDLPAPGGPLVYDRMILHLDDGTDLSLLRTRRRDGRGGATLDGVLVDADGTAAALAEGAAWRAGTDGLWTLTGAGLELRARELPGGGLRDFAAPVRHAGLSVEGTREGRPVRGTGTLLLSPEAAP
ncbi:MAG: lipocalin-like domain-containing protein [Roseicyclus sp.]